jgi:NADH-quinone oxidoreductase subunit J
MLAPDTTVESNDRIPWQKAVGIALGLILAGALSFLIFSGQSLAKAETGANGLSQQAAKMGDVQAFGNALFHGFLFPFEVTSLLIVIAILGALVFGRRA